MKCLKAYSVEVDGVEGKGMLLVPECLLCAGCYADTYQCAVSQKLLHDPKNLHGHGAVTYDGSPCPIEDQRVAALMLQLPGHVAVDGRLYLAVRDACQRWHGREYCLGCCVFADSCGRVEQGARRVVGR